MPADGVSLTDARRLLSAEELLRLAALFVRAGVDKIRLTGGEPTVRPDLATVVGEITTLCGPWSKGVLPRRTDAAFLVQSLELSLESARGHGCLLSAAEMIELLPGTAAERRSPLGELHWILVN